MQHEHLTISQVAAAIGVSLRRTRYAVDKYGPQPSAQTARYRLWHRSQLGEVKQSIAKVRAWIPSK